jgi:F-type H+-transporting ATPase subunit delta
MIEEKRIGQLPLIYKEIIVLDDHKKGFLKGTIESSDGSVDEEIKNQLLKVMKEKLGANIELNVKKNDKITAGYKVTVGDLQIDATIDNQLEQLKRQILAE